MDRQSPDVKQALYTEMGSRARVRLARATYRGSLTASAQYGTTGSVVPYDPRNLQRALIGQITYSQPLYNSGLDHAQIHQALELNNSDRFTIETVRRGVLQNLANGWSQMVTADRSVTLQEAQVKAATIAFQGMRLEYRAGDRSTLDVLVAEETLRDAELLLVAAHHDLFVAKAIVLRQIGGLEPQSLISKALIKDLNSDQPSLHFHKLAHAAVPWKPLVEGLDRFGLGADQNTAQKSGQNLEPSFSKGLQ